MLLFTPPVVPNCDMSGNFRVGLRSGANNDLSGFCRMTRSFVAGLRTHPRVRSTRASFGPGFPRCVVSVSTTTYGGTKLSPDSVLAALRKCCNNLCSSGFGQFNGVCHMVVRTSPGDHAGLRSLGSIGMHGNGRVTPVARFVDIGHVCKPSGVGHFGVFATVAVGNSPTSKCDSNRTVRTVRRITRRALPAKCKCRFSNVAHRRRDSDNDAATVVFILYFMFICLLLDTRCRDCVLPFTMLLSVPFNLTNDFVFTRLVKLTGGILPVLKTTAGGVCVRVTLVVLVNLLTGGTVLVMRFTLSHHGVNVDVA